MFCVVAMSPENLNTILSCNSLQLVFWHLWEDCCQCHSPAITKAITYESSKEERKENSYCLFKWHESKVSCMERGQVAPQKEYGRQHKREWQHADSSMPLQRGTHTATSSHGTRAQDQPVTHLRERLEVLITHLNEERTGTFFP